MPKTSSPLRYPGGKTKLYNYISEFIEQYYSKPPIYAEAFAGGFGIGIKLLLNDKAELVLLNDYDPCIYAFWKCITSDKYIDGFIDKIISTDIDIESWEYEKNIYLHPQKNNILDVGYATFHLNRCNRSGILMANPIGGISQEGKYKMDCRFNKPNLISQIKEIYNKRDRIKVSKLEANDFARRTDKKYDNLLFNFDPPYVNAGPMLYKSCYNIEDHKHFSDTVHLLKNRWIITYDDNETIRSSYSQDIIRPYRLMYSLEEKCMASELIIYDKRFENPPVLDLYRKHIRTESTA